MGDQGPTGGPPPGWYPDPQQAGRRRWWDGRQWTEHTSASTPPTPQGPGGAQPPRPVDTWLWQSIAVTVLCCMPLGLVGIVFAAQAQGALSAGNHAEARRKADTARSFTIAGFVLGLLLVPFVFLAGI